jgi:hypothetical protein
MRLRELWVECLIVAIAVVGIFMPGVGAESLQSPTYRIDESSIGTSDPLDVQSNSYGLTSGTGDIGVGNSASSNYQVNAGSKTSADPVLAFSVDASSTSFGDFSPTSTAATTLTFQVKDYTTYGYVVQIYGTGPTYNGHEITPMASTGPSQVGTEQFGINLVANTSPANIGANPDNGEFGNGSVETEYSNANNYRYVSGETIASAPGDSGETNYTVTFIANVGPLTPGGSYKVSQTLIATGTY